MVKNQWPAFMITGSASQPVTWCIIMWCTNLLVGILIRKTSSPSSAFFALSSGAFPFLVVVSLSTLLVGLLTWNNAQEPSDLIYHASLMLYSNHGTTRRRETRKWHLLEGIFKSLCTPFFFSSSYTTLRYRTCVLNTEQYVLVWLVLVHHDVAEQLKDEQGNSVRYFSTGSR